MSRAGDDAERSDSWGAAHVNTVPLSILDLAPISAGSDAATALHNTIDLAQHAEQWGYRRFWIAEHHFVGVASSAPAVLIGQIAAATNTIRVGSAAVQLSHTTAAAVVESFGMLDAFYPGRIDLGVGRGQRRDTGFKPKQPSAKNRPPRQWREVDGVVIPLPFDLRGLLDKERVQATMGILQQPEAVSPDFAEQLGDIIAMLDGTYEVEGFDVHAVPGERSGLTPWIFGSTRGQSARLAGARGLPFVASYHITPATALEAIDAYRDTFVPSATLQRALRRGVCRHRGCRRQRHRKASGRRLRTVGVFHPNRGGRRALPGSRRLPSADR